METNTIQPKQKVYFDLTTSPHLHSKWSTAKVMWFVNLALVPCIASALIFFGIQQILIMLVAVSFAVGTEAAIQAIRKKKVTLFDGSAALTGLLLSLTLPPNFSLSATAIGSVVAIGLGKQIFGGIGYNIFNPALVGRAFLQAAFPVQITTWTKPNYAVDSVTSATPLAAFKFDKLLTETSSLAIGNVGGSLGETSAIAVLLGGIFLIAVGIVNWRIPLSMIIGMFVFGGTLWFINPQQYPSPVFQIFAGSFLFGAMFMATDWVTSPITNRGMWIFGIGISLILILIRIFGGLPEGVMYSILFMNAFVPIINRYTRPRIFGEQKEVTK
ncbi:MAG: RnfABCDGE type electron transport complex subunit D [Ignavibacterium album]|uniref:RnfABCDGE type electron transport complex subunit D n=1 Tax=Ignavibacterium album TaxID=591197 RepID=UPI0026ED1993|nr:RnfABCDGE type electron transport complex subunit D [Ignavibacterium album]MCX8104396.1 RnfABCDGE type electron transport complex subunit D [Ignavibacterium album]